MNSSKPQTMGQLRAINRALKKRERFLKTMRKLQLDNARLHISISQLFEKTIRGVVYNTYGDIIEGD